MNNALTISLASLATVVVVCGIYYYFRKKGTGTLEIKKVDSLNSSDILAWIDKVSNEISPKDNAKYEVKVLPNSSTNELLNKRLSNVYAAIFIEQLEGKNTIIAQQFYQAINITDELSSLKNDNVIIIPIEY